eukprot:CAMPEP_0201623996 /NCGR_PEP_ID=MMETSP0493-20130528/327_1 /ASSEMBLY_ACC=CAM_ASM_000838 /TAXON_ID=420259 /ORGANISM="Thalassiosira gravida, Strain GMp14c1" /LENGTH=297 /DNA_ID=CAMNT_0048093747 /DNA_START=92 /DNA_END=985 /DNA_ORIENTATION=+
MSSSQLHNPREVWFLGAPVSKAIAISTAIVFVVAEMNKWHDALMLDTTKIFDHAQFYRIFVCNLTFASMGELIFGSMALCPLMRRFEREMGSRRFAAFIIYSSFISTIFELIVFNIFFDIDRYSGPYPQLGAVLALYHKFTPRLHPKFFGVLGYDFSEKSMIYGLCAQVILSGGLSTIIPTFVGFLSGLLCVNLSETELPEFVYTMGLVVGKAFVDESPPIMMSRTVQRGAERANRPRGAPTGGARAPAPAAPRPPPPPPEEAIVQLTSMGFERQAVVRALQQTDNNIEAAANRLMG